MDILEEGYNWVAATLSERLRDRFAMYNGRWWTCTDGYWTRDGARARLVAAISAFHATEIDPRDPGTGLLYVRMDTAAGMAQVILRLAKSLLVIKGLPGPSGGPAHSSELPAQPTDQPPELPG